MRTLMFVLLSMAVSDSEWREKRVQALKADDGWLTVTGLAWLKPGTDTVGTRESDDVALARGACPERVGTIELSAGTATFRPAGGGAAIVLRPDTSENPNFVMAGRLKLLLLKRGDRYAIRVKDNQSEFRKKFAGLRWYPVDENWRVTARFVRYEAPRKIRFSSAAGTSEEMDSPGYVEFTRNGSVHRLLPAIEGDSLFFVFRDETSAKSTYGGGRFLNTEMPRDGKVVLDFNRAVNPPCAFTPYATCPLPPKENRLPIEVTAGEMTYLGQH